MDLYSGIYGPMSLSSIIGLGLMFVRVDGSRIKVRQFRRMPCFGGNEGRSLTRSVRRQRRRSLSRIIVMVHTRQIVKSVRHTAGIRAGRYLWGDKIHPNITTESQLKRQCIYQRKGMEGRLKGTFYFRPCGVIWAVGVFGLLLPSAWELSLP